MTRPSPDPRMHPARGESHTPAFARRAYAKVNLALAVGGPRSVPSAPGFHAICSVFAPLALWDDVVVTPRPAGAPSEYDIAWASDAPRPTAIDWPHEKDLAVRAHRLMEEHLGRAIPVRLVVRKRVPVGSGLGGGSSDAAAALLALRDVASPEMSLASLRVLGARLGSDVAYFLDDVRGGTQGDPPPRAAIVSGVGEVIEPWDRPLRGRLIIVMPPCSCPTGPVYKALDAHRASQGLPDDGPPDAPAIARFANGLRSSGVCTPASMVGTFNDLWPAAVAVAPMLARVRAALPTEFSWYLTGSGSAIFAAVPPKASEQSGAPGQVDALAHLVERHLRDAGIQDTPGAGLAVRTIALATPDQ